MSLLTIEVGIFGVMATAGDRHLGGEDLTTVSWTAASRLQAQASWQRLGGQQRITLSRAYYFAHCLVHAVRALHGILP